jgi:hypothetical protein
MVVSLSKATLIILVCKVVVKFSKATFIMMQLSIMPLRIPQLRLMLLSIATLGIGSE